jgi:hypothetical protein
MSTISNNVIIVISNLTKDMTRKEDSHQETTTQTLFKIIL